MDFREGLQVTYATSDDKCHIKLELPKVSCNLDDDVINPLSYHISHKPFLSQHDVALDFEPMQRPDVQGAIFYAIRPSELFQAGDIPVSVPELDPVVFDKILDPVAIFFAYFFDNQSGDESEAALYASPDTAYSPHAIASSLFHDMHAHAHAIARESEVPLYASHDTAYLFQLDSKEPFFPHRSLVCCQYHFKKLSLKQSIIFGREKS